MAVPLNRIPSGLLAYFGIKSGEWGPRELGQQLAPVLDLRDWYMQPDATEVNFGTGAGLAAIAATRSGAAFAITATNPVDLAAGSGQVTVPQGELWLMLEADVQWGFSNGGAGAVNAYDATFISGNPAAGGAGQFTWPLGQLSGFTAGVAGYDRSGTRSLDHPFWVRGGDRISFYDHGALVGAGSIVVSCHWRFVRLSR